jgi:hypothetical protein
MASLIKENFLKSRGVESVFWGAEALPNQSSAAEKANQRWSQNRTISNLNSPEAGSVIQGGKLNQPPQPGIQGELFDNKSNPNFNYTQLDLAQQGALNDFQANQPTGPNDVILPGQQVISPDQKLSSPDQPQFTGQENGVNPEALPVNQLEAELNALRDSIKPTSELVSKVTEELGDSPEMQEAAQTDQAKQAVNELRRPGLLGKMKNFFSKMTNSPEKRAKLVKLAVGTIAVVAGTGLVLGSAGIGLLAIPGITTGNLVVGSTAASMAQAFATAGAVKTGMFAGGTMAAALGGAQVTKELLGKGNNQEEIQPQVEATPQVESSNEKVQLVTSITNFLEVSPGKKIPFNYNNIQYYISADGAGNFFIQNDENPPVNVSLPKDEFIKSLSDFIPTETLTDIQSAISGENIFVNPNVIPIRSSIDENLEFVNTSADTQDSRGFQSETAGYETNNSEAKFISQVINTLKQSPNTTFVYEINGQTLRINYDPNPNKQLFYINNEPIGQDGLSNFLSEKIAEGVALNQEIDPINLESRINNVLTNMEEGKPVEFKNETEKFFLVKSGETYLIFNSEGEKVSREPVSETQIQGMLEVEPKSVLNSLELNLRESRKSTLTNLISEDPVINRIKDQLKDQNVSESNSSESSPAKANQAESSQSLPAPEVSSSPQVETTTASSPEVTPTPEASSESLTAVNEAVDLIVESLGEDAKKDEVVRNIAESFGIKIEKPFSGELTSEEIIQEVSLLYAKGLESNINSSSTNGFKALKEELGITTDSGESTYNSNIADVLVNLQKGAIVKARESISKDVVDSISAESGIGENMAILYKLQSLINQEDRGEYASIILKEILSGEKFLKLVDKSREYLQPTDTNKIGDLISIIDDARLKSLSDPVAKKGFDKAVKEVANEIKQVLAIPEK